MAIQEAVNLVETKIKIQVRFFGQLKDYFSDPEEIDLHSGQSIANLRKKLLEINNRAEEILDSSRWAVDADFIDQDFIFKESGEVCILPPSSGG